jgi:uncharacterized membrane protein HdeD (DUF308 family)
MRVSRLLLNRSLLWLVLGITVWMQPGIALTSLTLLLGVALLIDGVLQVVHALGGAGQNGRWAGFVGIAQGVLSFLIHSITPQQVLIYLAFWGIATGSIEMIVALRERKQGGHLWFVLAGVAGLGFGLLLLSRARDYVGSLLGFIAIGTMAFAIVLAALAVAAYLVAARRSNSAVGTRA